MMQVGDFEAVVLAAGKGSRMMELTAGKPKCLLPIGNYPMIWYPLRLLEKTGFNTAFIIVAESSKSEIISTLDKLSLKIKLEMIGVSEDDLGTADSMRLIYEKVKKDCLVISCDLIANVDITPVLNLYRKHNASITALMLPVPKISDDTIIAGPKSKQKPETDLIGIEAKTNRLVFFASASDFEENVFLPARLSQKHTDFNIHSKLLDAHLYVMNKWVLKYLAFNKSFISIKGDFLPYIISKQLAKPPKCFVDDKNTSIVKLNIKEDIQRFCSETYLDGLSREMSSFNDCNSSLDNSYHDDIIRCYAYKVTEQCGLRANTIQMYSLANATIDKWWEFGSNDSKISPNATVKSTQLQDCRIDNNVLIDEKTSLKESNIGAKSTVETKTRISNSIIMDNVTIKQKCAIINSILCNGCVIENETVLKNCLVGAKFTVSTGQEHSHEMLTDADELMEI
ncbi:translation initiation factor eIF-2B subunit gamma [Leptopilina heterotoma]|uniref:translation initiation factor eIF-2B subunit gamma n=1 Tax=Leptopilina heterotoma TaxID=63436 RepID=UPI001CA7C40F|nr:translation initiation factor eIF-2B subunit gamma [Leptopilina heterotoma]